MLALSLLEKLQDAEVTNDLYGEHRSCILATLARIAERWQGRAQYLPHPQAILCHRVSLIIVLLVALVGGLRLYLTSVQGHQEIGHARALLHCQRS